MNMTASARSAATLVVLALLFVGGVAWAWSRVTAPFPESPKSPDCNDTLITAGEEVAPGDVLVSVLNASGRDGLAGETMDRLERFGFGTGELGNAADIKDGAQIWTSEPDGPVATLLASYLGKDVRMIDQASTAPGVTVLVGDRFPGVSKGMKRVTAGEDISVCSPPASDDASDKASD